MKKTILLVEDDENLAFLLGENLEIEGYQVTRVSTAEEVLPHVHRQEFTVILMDVDLGGEVNGFEVAESVRKFFPLLPIIFTTGKTHFKDTERGLCIGYVDYLKKPFGSRELMARINNLLNRNRTTPFTREYSVGGFSFSPINNLLRIDDHEEELSKTESEFLTLLCENLNKVVKKEDVVVRIWGENTYPRDHSINNLIHRTRLALRDNIYVELKTISKVGYRLVERNL